MPRFPPRPRRRRRERSPSVRSLHSRSGGSRTRTPSCRGLSGGRLLLVGGSGTSGRALELCLGLPADHRDQRHLGPAVDAVIVTVRAETNDRVLVGTGPHVLAVGTTQGTDRAEAALGARGEGV